MTIYNFDMMNKANYNAYMMGSNDYKVETISIEAETKEQAYEIACAKYPEMVINKNAVTAKAETITEEPKAKKVIDEKTKAHNYAKRYEREIRKMREEIARMEKEIAIKTAKMNYWKEVENMEG